MSIHAGIWVGFSVFSVVAIVGYLVVLYAFVQAVDTGFKGDLRVPKQYWGMYSYDEPRKSIVSILEHGGKWPSLPSFAVTSKG